MSDATRPLTPPPPPPGRGRRRRWPWIVALSVLAVAVILVGLDRAAAAYAENRIAQQVQSHGFPSKPAVTVEGFPFLTQVISHHLDGIDLRSSGLREGPVTLSLDMLATSIRLNSGYNGGTIGQVSGTGLIGFGSIASLASSAGAPGLAVSAAGPHELKLTANLDVTTVNAIARLTRVGSGAYRIQVVSAGGLPASLLGPISGVTVHIPRLPLGLAVRSVSVTRHGVRVHVTGSNIAFGS